MVESGQCSVVEWSGVVWSGVVGRGQCSAV